MSFSAVRFSIFPSRPFVPLASIALPLTWLVMAHLAQLGGVSPTAAGTRPLLLSLPILVFPPSLRLFSSFDRPPHFLRSRRTSLIVFLYMSGPLRFAFLFRLWLLWPKICLPDFRQRPSFYQNNPSALPFSPHRPGPLPVPLLSFATSFGTGLVGTHANSPASNQSRDPLLFFSTRPPAAHSCSTHVPPRTIIIS